jgi:uncharacterized Fe-S cluster-containing radical SAM superfamily enzyme
MAITVGLAPRGVPVLPWRDTHTCQLCCVLGSVHASGEDSSSSSVVVVGVASLPP